MYYDKKHLEQLRKDGEEKLNEMELEKIGKKYKANEIEITCVHCNHDKFELGKALLNTRSLSFFDLDWLNKSANTVICKKCGYIHWFGKEVVEVKER
ncbi:MAG: zinc ribbon domain-containing protein [Anaerobacillus sp.]|uniref:zinc ribbon domain-containing protein n=1 Tax=Anaerobacillus sp. TaxID=1872506 RepID=UPI00391A2E67